MTLEIAQVCADPGIAPGATKGAARHLAGVAGGLERLGHRVMTYSERTPVGTHPVRVVGLDRLADSRPDIVYERYSLSSGAALTHARRVGVPFVLEVNAPLVDEANNYRPDTVAFNARARENEIISQADVVIAVSRPLARWIRELRDGPIMVIPNGFEPDWYPTGADVERADERLVFVGHPKPWHGADRIPHLVAELNRRDHEPSVLIIGGGDGTEALVEQARRLGVEDQIEITGALAPPEASRLVATATIGLAPYRSQRHFYFSPLKILDYLAAGLAIVSTNQGDIAELVGDAGIVVDDPDDDDAFIDAVSTLLSDQALRVRMGRSGRRRAFATHTWDHVAARTAVAMSLAQQHATKVAFR